MNKYLLEYTIRREKGAPQKGGFYNKPLLF